MRVIVTAILLAVSAQALANGKNRPPPPDPVVQLQLQGQAQQQQQNATSSSSSAASIAEGAVVFQPGSIAMTDADAPIDASTSVSVTTDSRVNAPPVYAPPVNPTAPYLKCLSIGGSGSNGNRAGGASGAWCWIARDIFAEQQMHTLAGMCMPKEAAAAYCTKFNARPFGGVADCKTKISAGIARYCSVIAQPPEPTRVNVIVDKPCCNQHPPGNCPEKLKRCENHAAGKGPKFKPDCDGTPEDCLIKE